MTEQLRCPYCGSPAKLTTSQQIYGSNFDYGAMWCCVNYPLCHAYVGCHPGTEIPLGRLANKELREAKKKAHAAFDRLWIAKAAKEDISRGKARGLWVCVVRPAAWPAAGGSPHRYVRRGNLQPCGGLVHALPRTPKEIAMKILAVVVLLPLMACSPPPKTQCHDYRWMTYAWFDGFFWSGVVSKKVCVVAETKL